jgi:hypothetical protein
MDASCRLELGAVIIIIVLLANRIISPFVIGRYTEKLNW